MPNIEMLFIQRVTSRSWKILRRYAASLPIQLEFRYD
jgi:hypothetical protein